MSISGMEPFQIQMDSMWIKALSSALEARQLLIHVRTYPEFIRGFLIENAVLYDPSHGAYKAGTMMYFSDQSGAKRYGKLSDTFTGDWDKITPILVTD